VKKYVRAGDMGEQSIELAWVIDGKAEAGDKIVWAVNGISGAEDMLADVAIDNGKLTFKALGHAGEKATVKVEISGFSGYAPAILDVIVETVDSDITPVDFALPGLDKIYDGKAVGAKATVVTAGTGIGDQDINTVWTNAATGATLDAPPRDAGEYRLKVSASPDPDTGRLFIGEASRLFTIAKKQVLVAAGDVIGYAGSEPPELEFSIDGFLEEGSLDADSADYAFKTLPVATYGENAPINSAGILVGDGLYTVSFEPLGELNEGPGANYMLIHRNATLTVYNYSTISLSPTHSIIHDTGYEAVIEISFTASGEDRRKIAWSVDNLEENSAVPGQWGRLPRDNAGNPTGAPFRALLNLNRIDGGKKVGVKATEEGLMNAQTYRIRGDYDGRYTATATIETLTRSNIAKATTITRLLEATVVANKAEVISARVPITIGTRPGTGGLSVMDAEEDTRPLAGTMLVSRVEIGTGRTDAAFRRFMPIAANQNAVWARICPTDDRFIEVYVDMAVKNATTKNLVVRLQDSKTGEWVYTENNFNLQIVEKYPKITFATNAPLNAVYNNDPKTLRATSADGRKVDVISIAYAEMKTGPTQVRLVPSTDAGNVNGQPMKLQALKAGKPKLNVTVSLEGYKSAVKPNGAKNNFGNMIVYTGAVVNAPPKVKLDKGSLPMIAPTDTRLSAANRAGIRDSIRAKNASGEYITNLVPNARGVMTENPYNPGVLRLITNDKKVGFEQGYKIENVKLRTNASGAYITNKNKAYADPNVDVRYTNSGPFNGRLEVFPRTTAAKFGSVVWLDVYVQGAPNPIPVSVKLATVDPAKLAATIKPAAYVVNNQIGNTIIDGSLIAEFPVNVNAANVRLNDFGQVALPKETSKTATAWARPGTPAAGALTSVTLNALNAPDAPTPVRLEYGTNSIRLVANKVELERMQRNQASGANDARDKKYALTINSRSLLTKNITLTLTLAGKEPAYTIAWAKNNIDVASPGSVRTGTVKLAQGTSAIKEVRLYEQAFIDPGAKKPVLDRNRMEATLSRDFYATVTGPGTFNVAIKPERVGYVSPKIAQTLSVVVVLENGQTMRSWATNAKGVTAQVKGRTAVINPASAVPRGNPAKLADTTLYVGQPMQGAKMTTLDINKAAAPLKANVGAVQIQAASVKAFENGGFRLERNGENEYSVYFVDDDRPYLVDKNNKRTVVKKTGAYTPLKANYTIKVELWAEGTYQLNPDGTAKLDPKTGKVMPYYSANGKTATTKPLVLNQKVNIRQ